MAECPPKSTTSSTPVSMREDGSAIQSDGTNDQDWKQRLNKIPTSSCQSSFATERLMSKCVAKSNCSAVVESAVFGAVTGCKSGTELHAKATYACVSRQVLKGFFSPGLENRGSGDGSLVPGGGDGWADSHAQEGGNTGHDVVRVTEDYSGFVDAPRYEPEKEQRNGQHYGDRDDDSRRLSGNPFTQIRRLFRNEDQKRGKDGSKSDDQAITGVIDRNVVVRESDSLTHTKLITRGVNFWVSMTSFIRGTSIISSNNHCTRSSARS